MLWRRPERAECLLWVKCWNASKSLVNILAPMLHGLSPCRSCLLYTSQKAVARIQKLKLGPIDDPETQLGCLISEEAAKRVEMQVRKTVDQGGKIVLGGIRDGAFYQPTVIADVPRTADIALDMEVFGPVVPIIGFDTIEEAIEIANASKYCLLYTSMSRVLGRFSVSCLTVIKSLGRKMRHKTMLISPIR